MRRSLFLPALNVDTLHHTPGIGLGLQVPWPRLPPGAGQKDVGTGTQKQLSEKAARQPAREYAREHIRRHFADALQLVLQGTNGHTYCGIEYTLLARRHRLGLCRGLLVWHSVEACTAWPK